MLTLCYGGKYRLNPDNATYVRDGVPMCHVHTCERHNCSRLSFEEALRRREKAANCIQDLMPDDGSLVAIAERRRAS